MKQHHYHITTNWTGNTGVGTTTYASYQRSHDILVDNKPTIAASSDPAFLGDSTKYNPEELLLASISSCHMLWYLHLCATEGIVVVQYQDKAEGTMLEEKNGAGKFSSVTLQPNVVVKEKQMIERANQLHSKANEYCFIANSLNFKVLHQPNCSAQ